MSETTPVIDACVNHGWADQQELTEYMSAGWREYLGHQGLLRSGGGRISIAPGRTYAYPQAAAQDSHAAARRVATDPDALRNLLFDKLALERVVLGFDEEAFATALINPYLAMEIARAANEWTVDRWLPADARFRLLMLVATQVPHEAAEEIRRVGRNPAIVGVFLGGNGLGKSFGHPCYHPIYAAAAEMGLPIVIKTGSELPVDSPASVSGIGDPATYAEFRAMESHPLMTHVTNLITQGVFEKFPSLKVFLVGAGVLWVPALLWRLDEKYKGLGREVPWVRRLPSEYFRSNVRVGTWPLDKAPSPALLQKAFSVFDQMEDVLCYVGGLPNRDADDPATVARQLPAGFARKIMHDNAMALFRGLGETTRQPAPLPALS